MTKALDLFSLKNTVVVVTGGTQRYGKVFVEALAEAGGTVVLTSRDQTRADETAKAFRDRGLDVHGLSLDLADDESINWFVPKVVEKFGAFDVLVNNGRTLPQKKFHDLDRAELERLFTTNTIGLMLLTRAVIDAMKKNGGGNVVNIGSIYGIMGQDLRIYDDPWPNVNYDYAAQKGGLINLTRQLASVFGKDGIRVNCLSIGGFYEESMAKSFVEKYSDNTAVGRLTEPDDVKGPIVYLASEASRYMTGANMVVDGGWTIF